MNLKNFLDGFAPYESVIKNHSKKAVTISGVAETAQAQLIAALSEKVDSDVLIVTYSDKEARTVLSDLKLYAERAVMFPSKEYVFYNIETVSRASENARLGVLDKIISGNSVTVASVDALMTFTADRNKFMRGMISLAPGDTADITDLTSKLVEIGYKREDMIEGAGQFAVRGGILDVYVPCAENPVRVEFWDDEVDSIRTFDIDTQRTISNTDGVRIFPATETLCSKKRRGEIVIELSRRLNAAKKGDKSAEYIKTLEVDTELFGERANFPSSDKYIPLIYGGIPSLIDWYDDSAQVFVIDPKRVCERMKTFVWEKQQMLDEYAEKGIISESKTVLYKTQSEIITKISEMNLTAIEMLSHTKNEFKFDVFESIPSKTTVSFHGKLEYLFEDLKKWHSDGYTAVVVAAGEKRAKNLEGIFGERGIRARVSDDGSFEKGEIVIIRGAASGGYEYPELKFVLISENEIFKKRESRERRRKENTDRIKSYNDISVGDYVVHTAHGIGEYGGIAKMTVDGVSKDYLKILYRDSDVLYVPVDHLNLLYKYSGKGDDKNVKLNRLGTQEWSRRRKQVKESTDKLAKELIQLYAAREEAVGFAFSEDTPWQREFEDTFRYSETADQLRSIEEVKADMEKSTPMDRLLCGDVGFGKTEVALRAAFKAVCDSKQVVYLCPTTILAMQHYETFSSRMADFPINVEMLSRFRTQKQQTEILKKLKDGRVDIVIGTHRLLSEDVKFKDLGLLIIDEEQRFGVAHKERIKEMRNNIDVLTMTATPIPRTLHMAMTSVRDMSVLSEPPASRYPVRTYVLEHDENVICDAIEKELSRGGQVFYLYNSVRGIYHKAQWIGERFPDANVAVGHGKMNESELEDIMYDMANGTTQILVCTTIIETGLDIPNANTMIIENADKMGLAQLYQLRGRVGRSNRMAYAYLTYKRDKVLSDVSQKRLSAIREFTEFGSGFKIAMRDLEIRGAGNILGSEQHGHMDNVGYDMYCKILGESINEAKGIAPAAKDDVAIDISVNAYIPESYIQSENGRIEMYKKISAIETEEDESEIADELSDRYGDMPKPVLNIIAVAVLKIPSREVGCTEITQRAGNLTLKFKDGVLTPHIIFGLDGKYPSRIKVASADTPSITVKLTERDGSILEFVKNLLNLIKELQNTDK